MRIKICQKDTYPDEVIQIRERLVSLPDNILKDLRTEEFLSDQLGYKEWRQSKGLSELFSDLICVLAELDIVAYHNTRLVNPEDIKREGLIFSDKRYLDKLKKSTLEAGMDKRVADELVNLVKAEIEKRKKAGQDRANEVCFFYDMDYYQDYDSFLMNFGGELVDNALESKRGSDPITDEIADRIKKLGVPCVVEFFFPGMWFNELYREDIAKYMIKKWIFDDLRKDEGEHRYGGRLEKEIPASQIIDVHKKCVSIVELTPS